MQTFKNQIKNTVAAKKINWKRSAWEKMEDNYHLYQNYVHGVRYEWSDGITRNKSQEPNFQDARCSKIMTILLQHLWK